MSHDTPDPSVRQLQQLGTLADVVYAIVISLIPRPGANDANWASLGDYFRSESAEQHAVERARDDGCQAPRAVG